jgi:hypothetical protein
MRVEPPSPEVVALHEWTVHSITVQLAIHRDAAAPNPDAILT